MGKSLNSIHRELQAKKEHDRLVKAAVKECETIMVPTITTTMLGVLALVMHDKYVWGRKRLEQLMVYMGQQYEMSTEDERVSLDDILKEVREVIGIDLPEVKNRVM